MPVTCWYSEVWSGEIRGGQVWDPGIDLVVVSDLSQSVMMEMTDDILLGNDICISVYW